MKNQILFLICFLTSIFAYSQITFERNYGHINNYYDWGFSVAQTFDEGYIVAGYTQHPTSSNTEVYLIRTNEFGDTLWTKTFGIVCGGATAMSVAQTSDSGFILAGGISTCDGYGDLYLIKTDAGGDSVWTKKIGGPQSDCAISVKQTTDGGYIITGGSTHPNCVSNLYLVKTTTVGDTLWTKYYGGTFNGAGGRSVVQTYDDGYIVAGSNNKNGNPDIYLVRTNYLGDTLWTKTIGGPEFDDAQSVIQTADSGYIMAGTTLNSPNGTHDILVIRTDINGNTLWTKTYGGSGSEDGACIALAKDKGYIITGGTYSYGAGSDDVYLIRTKLNGDTLWTRTFGGIEPDGGRSVTCTTDGGFILAGWTQSYCTGIADVYLLKTDENGNIGGISDIASVMNNSITIYPIPATSTLNIECPQSQNLNLSLFNLMGEQVMQRNFTASKQTIDISALPSGMYIVKVSGGDWEVQRKVVKE